MTVKETLRRIIKGLSEEEAQDLLDYLNLQADPDGLSEGELKLAREGERAIAKGDSVTLEQLNGELEREA